ncbi:MAG TPA: MBL fold metallo-hydrolase [Acidimicrobiia bacterium]|jgi:glyoxylase-like metal-dependent hydrolase (beta-lactamase superfamily II)
MQLAPSLHRIGSDYVNVYLVADETGVTVVDAGLSGLWKEFLAELLAMGRELADVRAVLLTHGDSDHLGFAERLRREHGVPVYVHGGDAARARGEEKTSPSWGKVKVGPLLRFLTYAGLRGGLRTRFVTELRELEGGEELELPGRPRVIPIPGHSPGSVAYHFASVKAVCVGDALTTGHVLTGEQGPQPAPFTDDPVLALESLSNIESLDATWVLPGHGPPWSGGAAEAVRRVREAAAQAK